MNICIHSLQHYTIAWYSLRVVIQSQGISWFHSVRRGTLAGPLIPLQGLLNFQFAFNYPIQLTQSSKFGLSIFYLFLCLRVPNNLYYISLQFLLKELCRPQLIHEDNYLCLIVSFSLLWRDSIRLCIRS